MAATGSVLLLLLLLLLLVVVAAAVGAVAVAVVVAVVAVAAIVVVVVVVVLLLLLLLLRLLLQEGREKGGAGGSCSAFRAIFNRQRFDCDFDRCCCGAVSRKQQATARHANDWVDGGCMDVCRPNERMRPFKLNLLAAYTEAGGCRRCSLMDGCRPNENGCDPSN